VLFESVIVAVDDAAGIKAAFIDKSNGKPAQPWGVKQVGEEAAGFAIGAADEHPALVRGQGSPVANKSAGRVFLRNEHQRCQDPEIRYQQARGLSPGEIIADRKKGQTVNGDTQNACRVGDLKECSALGIEVMSLGKNHERRPIHEAEFRPEQPCRATVNRPAQLIEQKAGEAGKRDATQIEQSRDGRPNQAPENCKRPNRI